MLRELEEKENGFEFEAKKERKKQEEDEIWWKLKEEKRVGPCGGMKSEMDVK